MTYFCCYVRATSNSSANTEDTFIDLDGAANQVFKLVRVSVYSTATTAADNVIRVKIARKSASGAGTTAAGTEVCLDAANTVAAQVAATLKSGTNTFAAGTVTDTINDAICFNQRGTWEWVARDEQEKIKSKAGDLIGVNLLCSGTSQTLAVYVVWEE